MDIIREAVKVLRKHKLFAIEPCTSCYIFWFVVLSILHVPTVKGTEANCGPLTIPCPIIDPKKATYVILQINNLSLQGKDLRNNDTKCITHSNDFYEKCEQQMKGSYQNNTSMLFIIEPPWDWLRQKNYRCLIRYFSQQQPNIYPPSKKIDLPQCQGDNSTKTSIATTTKPHIPVTSNTTRKPNATSPENAPDECTTSADFITIKRSTYLAIIVTPSIVIFILVIIVVICFIRCCCRHRDNDPQVANGEKIPMRYNNNVDSSNGHV